MHAIPIRAAVSVIAHKISMCNHVLRVLSQDVMGSSCTRHTADRCPRFYCRVITYLVCSALPGSTVVGMEAPHSYPYGPASGDGASSIPVPADPPPESGPWPSRPNSCLM